MTAITKTPSLPTTAFALSHLEPYEIHAFLTDWREGKNLKPWLDALLQDRQEG